MQQQSTARTTIMSYEIFEQVKSQQNEHDKQRSMTETTCSFLRAPPPCTGLRWRKRHALQCRTLRWKQTTNREKRELERESERENKESGERRQMHGDNNNINEDKKASERDD